MKYKSVRSKGKISWPLALCLASFSFSFVITQAAEPVSPQPELKKSAVRFEGTDLYLGSLPPISFHGFASQGLLASTDYNYMGKTTDVSAEFNEFGLNASISPFNRTRISVQGFMFDLGNVGNYSPMLDFAVIDYSFNDNFGLRGGRIRRPMGIYNHIQDIDVARTFVLLPQGIYDARWRDFSTSIDGGSIYGAANAGKAGSFSYEAYAGFMNLTQDGGVARVLQDGVPPAPIGSFGKVEGNLLAGAQLWWNTPIEGLRVGGTAGNSFEVTATQTVNPPFGPGEIRTEIETVFQQYSVEYTIRSWTFQAEYQTLNSTLPSFAMGQEISDRRERHEAWYVGAAYRFNKWLETGVYYAESFENAEDHDGSNLDVPSDAFQRDLALAFRFDPKPWWTLKLEGHYLRGTRILDNNSLNPVRDDNGWFMLALKTTFSF